jgi:hypothetical protein
MFLMTVDKYCIDSKCTGRLAIDAEDQGDALRVQHRLWGGRSFTVETMPQHHVTDSTYLYCRGCAKRRFARLTGYTTVSHDTPRLDMLGSAHEPAFEQRQHSMPCSAGSSSRTPSP